MKKMIAMLLSLMLLLGTTSLCAFAAEEESTEAVEEVVSEAAVEDTESTESTDETGLGKQIVVLLCFAAGVGVLAAIYGVSLMVANRTPAPKKKEKKKTEEADSFKETKIVTGKAEKFDPAEWDGKTEEEDDGIAYEVTLDEDGNLIRKPHYQEFK